MASVWEIRWTEESQDGEAAGAVESSRRGVVVRRAGRRMVVREFMVIVLTGGSVWYTSQDEIMMMDIDLGYLMIIVG